jgi:hypothetical protein
MARVGVVIELVLIAPTLGMGAADILDVVTATADDYAEMIEASIRQACRRADLYGFGVEAIGYLDRTVVLLTSEHPGVVTYRKADT